MICGNVINSTCVLSHVLLLTHFANVCIHVLIAVEEAITAILEFKLTSKNICRVARIFFIFMANRTEYLTLLGRVRNMDSASMNVNAGRLAGFGAGLAMYLGWRGFCMLHNSNKQRQRPRSMSGMNS
eukprot:412764_1